jgi:CDP-paratose 2-epimerase
MKAHYPEWDITKSLDDIFQEVYDSWAGRVETAQ